MTEYIEREELAVEFMYADADVVADYGDGECEWGFSRSRIHEVINGVPSADVAPVRYGRWKEMHYEGGILDGTNFDRCSVCGYEIVFGDPEFKTVFKYCPNCGAVMEDPNA